MTAPRGADAPPALVVVTAVKALDTAKSRFAAPGDGHREAVPGLVLAMLRDVLAAALAVPEITAAYVVSPDPAVRAAADDAGARSVPEPSPGGLNAALSAGAAAARAEGEVAVLALQPDLPGVSVDELRAFLAAAGGRRAFVPDRAGTGTAALFSPAGDALRPAFGPDSASAHAGGGALALAGPWPGLRTDIDTPADLKAPTALGVHTTAAIAACDPGIASNSRC
ncbi:2-phospho-L-lactate guanylyltransferase [Tsukamurella sp. TY48]|uniref:2-phospho-L-lactate guanylyltransferase n=1 Tax=Tsukamurella sp. TY48 TaxID=2775495 RepID=UPI001C7CDB0C|nr:2-phospho-L-lactate guanylyltransferase [Tsukamurella sp. TY48]GIZ95907.1 2-phospho-L-lactate guanylyltransferase [Tsukamurella sp. TY48]